MSSGSASDPPDEVPDGQPAADGATRDAAGGAPGEPAPEELRDEGALLRAARAGDDDALRTLIGRNLPWLRERVRRRLDPRLRRDLDSDDLLQDLMLGLFQGPAFRQVHDAEHLRALLATALDKDLVDRVRWARRAKRDRNREQSLHGDSSWAGAPPEGSVTRPSEHAARGEMVDWIRAAMERLGPEDREVLRLRVWSGLDYAAIGERLGLAPDAARMRTQRALGRLARSVEALRSRR